MTKSHEEKLRAIKSVEDKKNLEISVLKAEIERLKSFAATASAADAAVPLPPPSSNTENIRNKMGVEEMQSKLESYQSFMAEYIVDSQNQKLAAVKEAESRMEKKFMEKIEKLLLLNSVSVNGSGSSSSVIASVSSSSTAVATTPAPAAAVAGGEQSLFQKRNSYIVQAADANKSRWGSMEIERAKEKLLVQPSIPSSLSSSAIAGAGAGATLFDRRNAQVIASAAAGKSRWGDMEVKRVMKNSDVIVGVNPHGSVGSLNSGGGQGTSSSGIVVSLEERVNLGARLLGA